ncbi:MAG: outer membrane beta-barrel protein [Pirellulaceae bacterium]|jgi:hypothetical protein|nr:outer membrane beta-barrel protein [Pirellulaceae bacterium]
MRFCMVTVVYLGFAIVGATLAMAEEAHLDDLPVVSDFDLAALESSLGADNLKHGGGACGCGKSCGKGGRGCSSWYAGGWLNGGVMVNFTNNDTSRNDPTPFSNPAAEFLANQAWLYFGKKADNGGCGWALGGRVDVMFGADGPDTQAFGDGGWDFGWNSGGEYGTAIPQIYGELAYNDLSIKIGHFYTILGYEVVQAPQNFFYSHSYAMTYGEPFTHTGLLAEHVYDDATTLWGGFTFGWDTGFDNLGDAYTLLGGARRQVSDNVTATYALTLGRYGNGIGASGNLGDIYSHSLVLDVELTDRLNYVFVHDLSINYALGGPAGNAEWYGVSSYLLYTINDCWKAGLRIEWFDDADGLRISTVNDGLNDLHYWGATVGLNWTPRENITVRPEFRFDWATSHSDMDFNDVYINNTKDNIDLFALDVIWTF